jgi:hypothetical protein
MSGNLFTFVIELELCLVAAATLTRLRNAQWASIWNLSMER